MKQVLTIVLASALITAAAVNAAPALPEVPDAPSELNVSLVRTADLDLRTADGQRRLEQRLANAAREVCGTASDVDLEGKQAVRKCRDETLAKARAQREAALAGHDLMIAATASR